MEEKHILIYMCKDDQGGSRLEARNVEIEEIALGKETPTQIIHFVFPSFSSSIDLYMVMKNCIDAIMCWDFSCDITEPPVNRPGGLLLCLKDLRSELQGRQPGVSYLENIVKTSDLMTTNTKQVKYQ